MKRYGDLFEKIISPDNLRMAHYEARRGKADYREVRMFDHDPEGNVLALHDDLKSDAWHIAGYRTFETVENGKKRIIHYDPCYRNNVVQHAIQQIAGPIMLKASIPDSFAGIPGRGIHKGVQRTRKFLSQYWDLQPIYIMKIDIRKFYRSIDHNILKRKLANTFKDRRLLDLLGKIIDSHSPGLPIGNYLSQSLANFYLAEFDRWIKDQGFKHYARYCDDIVVIHSDKAKLNRLLADCREQLSAVQLEIKPNAQVFPIERSGGLDFLGYVFTRHRVLLRKSIERRFRRTALRYQREPTRKNLERVTAYYGWLKWLSHGDRLWSSVFHKTLDEMQKEIKDDSTL